MIMDYSAMTIDAAYIKRPVFLYVYDLRDYINDRGELMWDLQMLPFPHAENMDELVHSIEVFDNEKYYEDVAGLFNELEVKEDGNASKRMVDVIENKTL
ncbi:CDP-glycerol glycerophosphotransferase family protein [Anaerovibrio lipolyticus]|nr:CDP-glycerol glycerophosphotransferase family protein [Anaerovibrio lipolyticus]